MGNDGGSIPHREDMIKEKPKERKRDQALHAHQKSRICSLSSQNLTKPIVADKIGNMFNKEAVLEALLNKSMPKAYCYIRKMKDVKDLNPTMKKIGCDKIDNDGKNLIVCPISGTEFDGYHKFTLIWSCGCVLATKVFDNMDLNGSCPNCGAKFKDKDKIDMTADPETTEVERKKLVEKTVLKKQEKRAKKEVNKEQEDSGSSTEQGKRTRSPEEEKTNTKRQKIDDVNEILHKESDDAWRKKVKISENKFKDKSAVEKKVKEKLEKDETFRSLFNDKSKEVKEQDFLCRSGYGA